MVVIVKTTFFVFIFLLHLLRRRKPFHFSGIRVRPHAVAAGGAGSFVKVAYDGLFLGYRFCFVV
jgi:hypothetical protein